MQKKSLVVKYLQVVKKDLFMIKLFAFGFLFFLWIVYGGITVAIVYHFKKYAVKKSYLGLVVIFIAGTVVFFLAELVLFLQINWQQIQEALFSFS